jgi:hypothetical protein
VSSLNERLQYSHEVVRKALINSKEVSKRYYDQKENTVTFREGDLVLLLQKKSDEVALRNFLLRRRDHTPWSSHGPKLLITHRYKETNLQGAQQQTEALHLIPDRQATRVIVGFARDVRRRRLHSQEL